MKILRTEYKVENNIPVIYAFCRENDKRQIIKDTNFVPYFYVPHNEHKTEGEEYLSSTGDKVKKISVTLPSEIPVAKERYSKTWEADVLYQNRWLTDKVTVIDKTVPRVMYLDIETVSDNKVPDPNFALKPIIAISTYDSLTTSYSTFIFGKNTTPGTVSRIFDNELHDVYYFKNETDMLKETVKHIRESEPDIITGWNLNRFDIPYLVNRLTNLGIDNNKLSPIDDVIVFTEHPSRVIIKGIALIDLYDAYRHVTFSQEESYRLGFIANKVVGLDKTQSATNVNWLWAHDLEALIEYNVTDVLLVKKIDEKMRLLEFLDELRRMAFCQLEDTIVSSRIVDAYILKMFHNEIVFPTKSHHVKRTFEGAYVHSWAIGLYDNVIVFDLKSLYPSIIISANLSPESLSYNGDVVINGIGVDTSKEGFLPKAIKKMFGERAKYKELAKQADINSDEYNVYDARQKAVKILLNAIYGQTAYVNSRLYAPKIAEAITFMGREIIKWSKNKLEELGATVLYVDTDGIYFCSESKLSTNDIEKIRSKLNTSYSEFVAKYNLKTHSFDMEFEKIYRKAFFSKDAKKRYAAHCIYKDGREIDELEIVGMEVRRSDAAQFSRTLQKTVLSMLLREDKDKQSIMLYIGEQIQKLRKGEVTLLELGIPKGINKELHEYEHPGSNVRGTIYARDVLGIELSSKPKLLYIKSMPKGYPDTDVLCFDEESQLPPGVIIDIETMLIKTVKSKIKGIFEALGWKLSEVDPFWKGNRILGNQISMWEK